MSFEVFVHLESWWKPEVAIQSYDTRVRVVEAGAMEFIRVGSVLECTRQHERVRVCAVGLVGASFDEEPIYELDIERGIEKTTPSPHGYVPEDDRSCRWQLVSP